MITTGCIVRVDSVVVVVPVHPNAIPLIIGAFVPLLILQVSNDHHHSSLPVNSLRLVAVVDDF